MDAERCSHTITVYGKTFRCSFGTVSPHIAHKTYIKTQAGRTACLTWSSVDEDDRPR